MNISIPQYYTNIYTKYSQAKPSSRVESFAKNNSVTSVQPDSANVVIKSTQEKSVYDYSGKEILEICRGIREQISQMDFTGQTDADIYKTVYSMYSEHFGDQMHVPGATGVQDDYDHLSGKGNLPTYPYGNMIMQLDKLLGDMPHIWKARAEAEGYGGMSVDEIRAAVSKKYACNTLSDTLTMMRDLYMLGAAPGWNEMKNNLLYHLECLGAESMGYSLPVGPEILRTVHDQQWQSILNSPANVGTLAALQADFASKGGQTRSDALMNMNAFFEFFQQSGNTWVRKENDVLDNLLALNSNFGSFVTSLD